MTNTKSKNKNINSKIIITTDGKTTTAVFYENDKKVQTAKTKCHPSDDFDFMTGANIVMERLTEAVEKSRLYNGRVVCIDNRNNIRTYTVGKIYQFVDGILFADYGQTISDYNYRGFCSFEDFANYTSSKFIEIVE